MRNKIETLSPADVHAAHVTLEGLLPLAEQGVGVFGSYVKRETRDSDNPETRLVQGVFVSFHGDSMMSNGSVRLLTPEGERVFNLYLLTLV